jgi:uncharacterized protein
MAHVQVHREDIELESPTLVEGLPGVGLVGKLAADHLVDRYGMTHYASCHCEGLPEVAIYDEGESGVKPPVRLYADADRDLLVLQSDVPVSPSSATEFAGCLTGWLADHDVTPIYLSGIPAEKDGVPDLFGVETGDVNETLGELGIDRPSQRGMVRGPTGALLARASQTGLGAFGLVVEANPQFPDPEAARVVLVHGIEPIADIEVDTDELVEQAEEISQAREELAQQMNEADDASSEAQPLGMYQ